MSKINEQDGTPPIKSALDAGIKALGRIQEITFTKYNRQILPFDGYVFWVADTVATPIQVIGSLHYETDQQQRADETIGLNRVVFTTQDEIQDFNAIADSTVWIGQIDEIRFAFTSRGRKYEQAGTYHYRGDAIYPVMYPQIIDNPHASPVDLGLTIATNSMPLWLTLNAQVGMYPAYMVASNLRPPYAAIEILETHPIQYAPFRDQYGSTYQLMRDKVRVVTHGLRSDAAIDLLNYVQDQSILRTDFGILNMPGIVDAKRGQSELGILAQKKEIEFEISYNQIRTLQETRQLILNAAIAFAPDPFGLLDYNFVLNQTTVAP
jgi:hypothetical protein